VLASTVLILRLAALYWGTTGFGEYALARRTLSLLELPLLLGMGLAVARNTAVSGGSRARGPGAGSYLASALLLVGVSGAAAVAALLLLARPLGFLLFGSGEYAGLVRALAVAVPGLLLHTLAYADLRGRVAMVPANVLQALNRGLAPLIVFAIPGLSVGEVVALTGALWLGLSTTRVVRSLSQRPPDWHWRSLWAGARELARYGAPRVPGEVALGALLALPAILAAHYGGVAVAGFVAVGVSLVNVVGSLFDPVGQIVLPTAAVLFSSGAHDVLRRDVRRLCLIAFVGSATILLALEVLAPAVVTWFLGGEFAPAIPVVRAAALGVVPYVMYVVLRNVLDAVHVRPLNAKNLVVGLSVFLVLAGAMRSAGAVPVAFTLGLLALGVLTARDAARLLRSPSGQRV
jgi:O-antigen/teichoic acid export membrane protein